MDGLSSAASVIAVIQLAGSILKICGGYIHEVKDARKEITSLQQQVEGITTVLEKLREHLQGPNGTKLFTSQILDGSIADCRSVLEALEKKIHPDKTGLGTVKKKMRRLGIRALKWPLKRTEVQEVMSELEKYKSLFTLSLSIDQRYIFRPPYPAYYRLTSISAFISGVSQTTNLIDQKLDFNKLPISEGAEFDSYEEQNEDGCLPGTRVEILRKITEWPVSPQGKCIFWLNGMAGTGKSTISRTVAKSFKQANLLGASFFFKRGEGDRKNAKKLFPTISRQIMTRIPQLELGIRKAISDEPNIARKSLREQFEKLVLRPLLALEQPENQIPTMVVVIDALDECEEENDIQMILQLLPRLQESNTVRFRIFLTSRPELPVNRGFSNITNHDYQGLVLHETPEAMTERDISLFLNHRLSQIREQRSLPMDWPCYTDIQVLVTLSVPLFIFAATVCRMLEDDQWDPIDSLTELFAHQSEESQLRGTYLPVLNRLIVKQSETQKKRLVQELQDVVGTIVILENPLSISSLSRLIDLPEKLINLRLNPLQSVLRIPKDPAMPVRPFHLSFRDFLLREKTEFRVDEEEMHQRLTARCFRVCDSLRRNICGLPSYGTLRMEIDSLTIDRCLSPELQYSCRYWTHHLVRSKVLNSVLHDAFLFLQEHFLHWIEAMSILGLVSEILGAIDRVQSVIQVSSHMGVVLDHSN
jgi:hypothetical protein